MKKFFYLLGTSLLFFALPLLAFAEEPVAQIKIISKPQSIATSTPSSVFTVEAQDALGNKVDVATTTRVNLSADSATGQFLTASASVCNTATTSSVTIANGSSHKSFCYIDESPGSFTLTLSVIDQPSVLGDSQIIVILGEEPAPTPTPTPSPEPVPTTTPKSLLVKIYRFLPNPPGEDSGNEWVEIKNSDENPVSLDGWFLDDEGMEPGSSAFVLSGEILPGEIKRIILPVGSFALNNSSGDEVNLYFNDKSIAHKVVYEATAYDDGIFELIDGVWQPPPQPSPGGGGGGGSSQTPSGGGPKSQSSTATTTAVALNIIISEIYPRPLEGGEEFLELYNVATSTANLQGAVLQIGNRKKVFEKGAKIEPEKYFVIYEDDLPVRLSNNGQTIKFYDSSGKLLAQILYPKAEEGHAYGSDDGKTYAWTSTVTAGDSNFYVLSEAVEEKESAKDEKPKTTASKSTSSGITSSQAKAILKTNEDLKLQISVLQESINQLALKLDNLQTQKTPAQAIGPPAPTSLKKGRILVWPTAIIVLSGIVYTIFRKPKD